MCAGVTSVERVPCVKVEAAGEPYFQCTAEWDTQACWPAGPSSCHSVTPPPLAAPTLSLSRLLGGRHAPGTMSFETGAYQDAVATLNPAGAPHPAPGDPSFSVRVKPVEAVFTLSLSDSCDIPNHLSVQVRSVFFFLLHPSRCAPSV